MQSDDDLTGHRGYAVCGLLALAVWLAGCATPASSPEPSGTYTPPADIAAEDSEQEDRYSTGGDMEDPDAGLPKPYEHFPGTGEFVNEKAARRPRKSSEETGEVSFNFEGAPLPEVVKFILGDLLGENYVIAPGVGGQVTFATAKPISMNQVLPILEMLLSWNNAALVFLDGRYQVMPRGGALKGNLTPRLGGLSDIEGFDVRAVPLQFISPTEMEKLLTPYARDGAIISTDNARSLIVLAGTKQELENYLQTVEIFDVDWLAGMSVGIFALERVEVDKVVTELEAVFGEGAGTPLAGMFRFLPLERLNAILVITPQPRYLVEAERWVERLDRGGSEAGARLYVYAVRNVKAVDLADQLNEVFGGGGGSRNRDRTSGQLAPGLQAREISSINDPRRQRQDGDGGAAAEGTPAQRAAAQRRGGRDGGIALADGDEISITAVEESNSLLIRANPQQYEAVLGAIKRLDIVPLQVHVDVKVVEVSLNDNLQYGVEWFLENAINLADPSDLFGGVTPPGGTGGDNGGDGGSGTSGAVQKLFSDAAKRGPLDQREFGTLGAAGFRFGYRSTNYGFILNLLETATDTKIISAPSLVVLNNREANINVGTQIPVVSTRFVNNQVGGGTNNTIGSVQFRDTGVTLNVVPRVNPGGMVFMEITQEVSSPTGASDPFGNVSVNRRQIDTEIAVQSGETVLLGGLIQEQIDDTRRGVPVLKDIPLIGGLFGSKGLSDQRTELLVLIQPTVLDSPEKAREVTAEYQRKFEGVRPFLLDREREQARIEAANDAAEGRLPYRERMRRCRALGDPEAVVECMDAVNGE